MKNSSSGAEVITTTTQKSGEAASKKIVLTLPSSLQTNGTAAAACLFNPSCKVGTASAVSPLAPVPLPGTVLLNINTTPNTLTIKLNPPYNLTIVGDINGQSVTFNNVPDSPLTSLISDITGTQSGRLYTTNCQPGNVTGQFTGQGGQSHTSSAPVQYTGCAAGGGGSAKSPTSSGSFSGLGNGHPALKLSLKHGANAPNLRSVSIGLGSGLSFNGQAIVKHKRCKGKGKHKKCTTTYSAKGLSVTGGKIKSLKLSGGRLVITLSKPASQLSIKAAGPLLKESKALQNKVKKHKVKTVKVSLKLTDAKGHTTAQTLKLKA